MTSGNKICVNRRPTTGRRGHGAWKGCRGPGRPYKESANSRYKSSQNLWVSFLSRRQKLRRLYCSKKEKENLLPKLVSHIEHCLLRIPEGTACTPKKGRAETNRTQMKKQSQQQQQQLIPCNTQMAGSSTNHAALIEQFAALVFHPNNTRTVCLAAQEVRDVDWGKRLMFKVVTTRPVGFQALREALHKGWQALGLHEITRFGEGLFVASFNKIGDRERVLAMGPWHFRQDLLAMKLLTEEPQEKDREECRVQLWVQIHKAPLQQMTKQAIKRVAQEIGDLLDPTLEGAGK
jgi:Domain of unknown function (DUF4283)